MNCLTECKYNQSCCSRYGVTLSKEEIPRFTGKIKIVPLTENHMILGYVPILVKKDNKTTGSPCVFFNEDTKLCEIYENRPQACKNFDCLTRLG